MSLQAPKTKEEGKFQYCNYGYDTTKFKSFDDCMTNYNKVFYPPTTTDLPTKTNQSMLKKISGAYNKNLIVAVVLVAGYFAYKKFKK